MRVGCFRSFLCALALISMLLHIAPVIGYNNSLLLTPVSSHFSDNLPTTSLMFEILDIEEKVVVKLNPYFHFSRGYKWSGEVTGLVISIVNVSIFGQFIERVDYDYLHLHWWATYSSGSTKFEWFINATFELSQSYQGYGYNLVSNYWQTQEELESCATIGGSIEFSNVSIRTTSNESIPCQIGTLLMGVNFTKQVTGWQTESFVISSNESVITDTYNALLVLQDQIPIPLLYTLTTYSVIGLAAVFLVYIVYTQRYAPVKRQSHDENPH
jgi:hypothetical protein